jgi:hypothetical protein
VPSGTLRAAILRFGLGLGVGWVVAFLVFNRQMFDHRQPMFQCISVGLMTAALLALLRSDRPAHAAALATAFALMRLGFVPSEGWLVVVAGMLQVAGLFLIALIFDLLARRGVLFGKFLVMGPMLGGLYLATTQLALFSRVTGSDLMPELMRHVFLGLLIGDSVGFGVEVADLLVLARAARQERSAS